MRKMMFHFYVKKIILVLLLFMMLFIPLGQLPLDSNEHVAFATGSPSVPTGLVVSDITGSGLTLSWEKPLDTGAGINRYEVYLDDNLYDTGSPSPASMEITGLSEYTLYSLKVKAIDEADHESGFSATVTARTKDVTPPSIPDGLAATDLTANGFTLTWDPSTDSGSGIKEYEVYKNGVKVATVAGHLTTYTASGLVPNTSYNYTVKAIDQETPVNDSPESSTLVVNTPDAPDLAPPSAPNNLKFLTVQITCIGISWNPSTDDVQVAGYEVYVNDEMRAFVEGAESAGYTITNLNPNTTYNIFLKAKDTSDKLSAASETITPKYYLIIFRRPYLQDFP